MQNVRLLIAQVEFSLQIWSIIVIPLQELVYIKYLRYEDVYTAHKQQSKWRLRMTKDF